MTNEENEQNGWDEFLGLLAENVKCHSELVSGKPRYGPDGISTITLLHTDWREVMVKLQELGVQFSSE